MKSRWKVGDKLKYTHGLQDPNRPLIREIVKVYKDGSYAWKYPDMGELTAIGHKNLFYSSMSGDPSMTFGWEKVES